MIFKAVMNDNEEQTMFLNQRRCIDFLAQAVYTDSDTPLSPARVC